jgi:hypothetical protein
MGRMVVVRYETRADTADVNEGLVEKVFAELNSEHPDGLRYMTLRLADGVSFVHVAVIEGANDPLSESAAFAEFQKGIRQRTVRPPELVSATLIGSYGFLSDEPGRWSDSPSKSNNKE